MNELKRLEQLGTNAVKRLRINKLSHGFPFMINVRSLPSNQCYLEYSGGRIVLAAYSSELRDFINLRELNEEESSALRSKLDLKLISTIEPCS